MAANGDKDDVTAAEYVRTYRTYVFPGGKLAQRLDLEKDATAKASAHVIPPLTNAADVREIHVRHFAEHYGYRGRDARVYYLNAWEFVM